MNNSSGDLAGMSPPARPVPKDREIEVRLLGTLLRRITPHDAAELVSRGWGQFRGSGRRQFVALTAAAPVSSLPHWVGDGTKPQRADQTCTIYAAGQLMGAPRSHREFLPTKN